MKLRQLWIPIKAAPQEDWVGHVLPDSEIRQNFSKENDIKLVGYNVRLKITDFWVLKMGNFTKQNFHI